MTTPASAPPAEPLVDHGPIVKIGYYDFTGQGIQGSLFLAIEPPAVPDKVIYDEAARNKTQGIRFVRCNPPESALFAVFRMPSEDGRGFVPGQYIVQWYGHGNRVVMRLPEPGIPTIRDSIIQFFRTDCLVGCFVYWHEQQTRFGSSESLANSIFHFNSLILPVYPRAIEYNKLINANLQRLIEYDNITPEELKNRLMIGEDLPYVETETAKQQTYIESDYHIRLMNALAHINDTHTSLQQQTESKSVRDAWTTFKKMLDTEPPNKVFGPDLLYRIDELLQHKKLPTPDKDLISDYKARRRINFSQEHLYFVKPETVRIQYTLLPISWERKNGFLFTYQLRFAASGEIEKTTAGGGKTVPKKEGAIYKNMMQKLVDDFLFEIKIEGKYSFSPEYVKQLQDKLDDVLELYELQESKDYRQGVTEDAINLLEEASSMELAARKTGDASKLPLLYKTAVSLLLKGLKTLYEYPPDLRNEEDQADEDDDEDGWNSLDDDDDDDD